MVTRRRKTGLTASAGWVLVCVLWAAWSRLAHGALLLPDEEVWDRLSGEDHRYEFWAVEDVPIRLTLLSDDFDAYLILLGVDRRIVAQDDDSAGMLNAQIVYTPPLGGWHTVVVTSLGGVGAGEYTLRLEFDSTAAPGPGSGVLPDVNNASTRLLPWGEPASGSLEGPRASFDPANGLGRTYYFLGDAGAAVSIRMNSDEVDPALTLYGPSGEELAFNDDADNLYNAEILAELPASGRYRVLAEDVWGSTEGAFTLSLTRVGRLFAIDGELNAEDDIGDGEYADEYLWRVSGSGVVNAWVIGDFDTYLEIFDEEGSLAAYDDDSGGVLDARTSLTLSNDQTLRVRVSSPYERTSGMYTLYLWTDELVEAGEPVPAN